MNVIALLAVLLLLAVVLGFQLGRYYAWRASQSLLAQELPTRYFEGLNFLLNEQPDKAVDVFIEMIEVNTDTVETHLALGSLFRRRGEVDRATRIHQNLIARPSLSRAQRVQALYELGQDYMKAGVFDRAEALFLELVNMGEIKELSLLQLRDIYQQQKDWQHAITVAQKLELVQNKDLSAIIAHYLCELAEEQKAEGCIDKMTRLIKRALNLNSQSVRAHLLQAEIAMQLGRYKQAVAIYRSISESHVDYLNEIITPLMTCFQQLQKPDEFKEFIKKALQKKPEIPLVNPMLGVASLGEQQNLKSLVVKQLQAKPSLQGIKAFVDLQCQEPSSATQESWQQLQTFVNTIMAKKPAYQCDNCGLNSKVLFWYCPSCKHWDTIKPLHSAEMSST